MIRPLPIAMTLGVWSLALVASASAEAPERDRGAEPPADHQDFASRQELNDYYQGQIADLERCEIADLADLAARQKGDEAEATYKQAFDLAVARDRYEAAQKLAHDYLDKGQGNPQLVALATLIDAIAQADQGHYDDSLQTLHHFLQRQPTAVGDQKKLDPALVYAVGESFLQRLIRAGRYDVARQVAELFEKFPDKGVQQHFASRQGRLALVGKPAPPIQGSDIDGDSVSLADLKDQVVLVDFWATWCPPCVTAVPELKSLHEKFSDRGFSILGVNLDTARQGIKNPDQARNLIRHFLLDFNIPWSNVINGQDGHDFAGAYNVTDIPARFLIGRDGTVQQVELSGDELEKAIAEALDK